MRDENQQLLWRPSTEHVLESSSRGTCIEYPQISKLLRSSRDLDTQEEALRPADTIGGSSRYYTHSLQHFVPVRVSNEYNLCSSKQAPPAATESRSLSPFGVRDSGLPMKTTKGKT
jgi:hypothetical protein